MFMPNATVVNVLVPEHLRLGLHCDGAGEPGLRDEGCGVYGHPDLIGPGLIGSLYPQVSDLPANGVREYAFALRVRTAHSCQAASRIHSFDLETAVAPPHYY